MGRRSRKEPKKAVATVPQGPGGIIQFMPGLQFWTPGNAAASTAVAQQPAPVPVPVTPGALVPATQNLAPVPVPGTPGAVLSAAAPSTPGFGAMAAPTAPRSSSTSGTSSTSSWQRRHKRHQHVRISRSATYFAQLPRARKIECLEILEPRLDATRTVNSSNQDIDMLVWLLTKVRPAAKLSDLRVKKYTELFEK